jgi:hypothetical protein
MIHPKALQVLRGKNRVHGRLPGQIYDMAAATTDEMSMVGGITVIVGYFVQGVHLDGQAFLAKNLQDLIHGIEGDGRQLKPDLPVNLLRGGMVPAILQVGQNCQALGGYGDLLLPQMFDEIFHNYSSLIIILKKFVKAKTFIGQIIAFP